MIERKKKKSHAVDVTVNTLPDFVGVIAAFLKAVNSHVAPSPQLVDVRAEIIK